MIITKKAIPRRTVLRGIGAGLAQDRQVEAQQDDAHVGHR